MVLPSMSSWSSMDVLISASLVTASAEGRLPPSSRHDEHVESTNWLAVARLATLEIFLVYDNARSSVEDSETPRLPKPRESLCVAKEIELPSVIDALAAVNSGVS